MIVAVPRPSAGTRETSRELRGRANQSGQASWCDLLAPQRASRCGPKIAQVLNFAGGLRRAGLGLGFRLGSD